MISEIGGRGPRTDRGKYVKGEGKKSLVKFFTLPQDRADAVVSDVDFCR
jgi:hypothetical protein